MVYRVGCYSGGTGHYNDHQLSQDRGRSAILGGSLPREVPQEVFEPKEVTDQTKQKTNPDDKEPIPDLEVKLVQLQSEFLGIGAMVTLLPQLRPQL